MINPISRTKEWILESCNRNSIKDPTLLEKTIRAFSLLEALAKSDCPFLFKGGSALMLQLGCTQRLSVDIDIVCPPGTDVIAYLTPFAEEYGFGEIRHTERQSRNNVPKTHAKCFYQVSYVTNTAQEKILLDVLFEELRRQGISGGEITVSVSPRYVSDFVGQKRSNIRTLDENGFAVKIKTDESLKLYQIKLQGSTR